METFQEILAKRLADALAKAGLPNAGELTQATDPRFGDYQSNAALILGKQRGENPRDVAEKILKALDVADLSETPTIAGAGFINFKLTADAIANKAGEAFADERLGVARSIPQKKIVIDFGSPNVAKPMHVGHIRSTALGDSLARVASFLGHDVIRDNHIGDWGTQFGLLIYGWKNLPEERTEVQLKQDPMGVLQKLYKYANYIASTETEDTTAAERRHERRKTAREQARDELVKLQQGDPENVEIWKECVELSKREFNEIYDVLEVRFDMQHGESFYNNRLPGVVERLRNKGIAQESDGAIVVFFRDIPELADKPCIIRKSDGGYNYATSDIATVEYRINDLKRDTLWYVVGAPQTLHFKQIFEIARREGFSADFRHIPFGNVLGEDRKLMKTRSGENVPLRQLLEGAVSRARKIVEEKNPELSEEEKIDIARIIGIGAVKYADLSQYRMTDYVFSWDKMLAFQGNTAPYLQNAYVRIRSIFRKADVAAPLSRGGPSRTGDSRRQSAVATTFVLNDAAEINLAKKLTQFAEIVPQVLNDFRPNILTNYLFELANSFHSFYEACPVLKSEEPLRSSRLALCNLTGRVLERGLDLLGIKVPEKM